MSAIPYTCGVLRYVHDPAAGGTLNVGVLLYTRDVPYVAARLNHHYERLSHAFVVFDGDHCRKTLRRFEAAIACLWKDWSGALPSLVELPTDVAGLGALVWPDVGSSFRLGPVLAGLTTDLEEAFSSLFTRIVTSQYARSQVEMRSDEVIWSVYQRQLARVQVSTALRPKRFLTPEFQLQFERSFKNERWHVLQPVSMDYARAESLQTKATRWLGNAVALKDHPDLGRLYFLLGSPQREAHRSAYLKAKNLLHKIPVAHDLVEEDEADDFARQLASYMREHGVLDQMGGE